MSEQPETLGDALPREMARIRDELMPLYLEIDPPGLFALTMMRGDLNAAAKAMAEGDVVAMLWAYESLKGYKA